MLSGGFAHFQFSVGANLPSMASGAQEELPSDANLLARHLELNGTVNWLWKLGCNLKNWLVYRETQKRFSTSRCSSFSLPCELMMHSRSHRKLEVRLLQCGFLKKFLFVCLRIARQ